MDSKPSLERQLLGKTLEGKYRLVRLQASGAFGAVFQAEQYFCRQLVRPVAVKVARQTGLTEETAPYLFGDALILARLLAGGDRDHDGRRHLVNIYDMGLLPEYDQRAFLVMEYVDGQPLLAHLRAAGRLGVGSGLRFVKQVCQAMALVHGQGAVHRDLKADNILVDRRGTVRVVDFGLAAFADPRLGFAPGSCGTFTYMAPETMLGRSTPASDVYSLGLLMYELFTGGGPHLSAPWSTDDQKDHRDEHYRLKKDLHFPPPSQVQNEIRNDYRWLDGLIQRCLEVEPEQRFADAGKLLAAIEACQAGESLPAPERSSDTTLLPSPSSLRQLSQKEALAREARRLLGGKAYDQVIDRLDVHRPAEWAVLDALDLRILRLLGQAYLGLGNLLAAQDCLEQLRAAQRHQPMLSRADYAAALSDLVKCYRGLGRTEQAEVCQQEVRELL